MLKIIWKNEKNYLKKTINFLEKQIYIMNKCLKKKLENDLKNKNAQKLIISYIKYNII